MKRISLIVSLTLSLLICFAISANNEYQKVQAKYGIVKTNIFPSLITSKKCSTKAEEDCYFCYVGWIYVMTGCAPELPLHRCYHCGSSGVTIGCLPPPAEESCVVINGPPECNPIIP